MKKFLSLVLALVMTMSLVTISAGAKDFADDDKITYDEAVAVISEIGVVDGYADGKFNPTNTLTRQAAAKIICNLILGPTTAAELHADTAPYKDVPTTSEFAGYIAYCAKEGIISGYADGTFKPGNTLTGYAFMKMLLGALGYDANYEQYVGANWSINVAKQALGIGLNDTLEGEFNGIKAVTREEAALYAFNTLKSTMVAYDNKITANVNGAEVTISNTNAKPVTWKEGINEDGNIKDDGFVQFAEEFFPKLVRKDDDTKFMEPANTWIYDKVEIGTFERKDLIVETYTEGVTGKDVYDLLKSGVIKENDLETYLDGRANTIEKDDLLRSNNDDLDGTDNGVLTKIYLDTDKDLITIVSINTYLAQATADYNEKKEYAPLTVFLSDAKGRNYNVDVADVKNIVDAKEDTFYQVNVSYKDNNTIGEVVIVKDIEVLEDSTVTKFTSKDGYATKLTTGGTEYKANVKAFYDDDVLYAYNETLLTDATYNVFVDQYGYFLGVELFEGTKNYVFIPGYDLNGSHIAVKTATASAIFLDGTMSTIQVNVTDTNKNIRSARNAAAVSATDNDHNTAYFQEWANNTQGGDDQLNQWYTYTVDADGSYTLKPCIRMTWTKYPAGKDVIIRTDNLSLVDTEGNKTRVYGEDETVFLTVETDAVSKSDLNGYRGITEVNGVYTGVQNVDLEVETDTSKQAGIDAVAMGQVFTVYDSDYYVIGAVVIGDASGATGNYAYILSGANYEEKIDDTYYWSFDAVLNGEIQKLIVKSKYTNAITPLVEKTVMELRFDGEYVTSIKPVGSDEEYTNPLVNIKDEDVYKMIGLTKATTTLNLQNRTMYIKDSSLPTAQRDVGLGLAKDAKAVVIQKENGKTVKTEFTSVDAAIAHLADADNNTANGLQYEGNIYAILDSNAAAKWIVFASETELKTGTQNGYGDNTGNLETIYKAKQTVDIDGDGKDELTLTGSSASGTFALNQYGLLTVNVEYTAPAWVPNGATVTLSVPVYYYGAQVATINFPATSIINGKATLAYASTAFAQFMGYDVKGFSFGTATVETFSAVNVYYFDQTGARLESKLTAAATTTTLPATGSTLSIKMPNTSNGIAAIAVTGISAGVSSFNWNYSDLAVGKTSTTTFVPIGNGPVVVTLNVSNLLNTYSVTTVDSTKSLKDLGVSAPTAFENLKLTVNLSRSSNIEPNGAVAITSASIDSAVGASSKVGMKVTLSTGHVLYFPNSASTSATVVGSNITVNSDVTITVTKVEEVAAPTVEDVTCVDVNGDGTWGNGDKIIVTYSEAVNGTAPTLTWTNTGSTTTTTDIFNTRGETATYVIASNAPVSGDKVVVSAVKSNSTGVVTLETWTITIGASVAATTWAKN